MADPVASLSALLGHPQQSVVPLPAPAPAPRPLGRPNVVPLPVPKARPLAKPNATPNAPAAPAKNKKSILGQIGGVFGGIVPGLEHVGVGLAHDAAGLYRVPYDMLSGKLAPSALWSNKGDPGHKYFPLTSSMFDSGEDTAGRLAQLGPVEVRSVGGRPVHTYGDVARNGEIVPTLLGDVANVAGVASVAGGALGGAAGAADAAGLTRTAAALGDAADIAKTTGRLAGRAANAPIEATTGVLKGGASVWRNLGQAAEDRARSVLPTEGPMAMPLQTTVEGRLSKEVAKQAMNEPGQAARFMAKNLAKDAGLTEKDPAMRPTAAEQEVGLTLASGVAQADKLLRDKLDPTMRPDVAREMSLGAHVVREEQGVTMTREGQDLAHQYLDGTLPPEQMARIDRVTQAYKKQEAGVTANALKGTGLIKGPMDPAFTGDAPIERQVDLQLEAAGVPTHQIDAMHQAMAQGATWDDMKLVVPELADVLLKPDVYPKPWREAMNVMAKGRDRLGLTGTPEHTVGDLGPARPGEFYHGSSGAVQEFHDYGAKSSESLFGPGVYTTDTPSVAGSYMKKGLGTEQNVYRLDTPANPKVMDLTKPQPELNDVISRSVQTGDWFDPEQALWDKLQHQLNDPKVSAEDLYATYRETVASAHLPRGEADIMFQEVNDALHHDHGYDALSHDGGVRVGKVPHHVTIWLNQGAVKIGENVTDRIIRTIPAQPGLPHTPAEMLAAGFERPSYMPTTVSNIGKEAAPATAPITSGVSSGLRGVANERHSATMGYGPYSIATAAEGLGKNIATTKFNSIIQRYVADRRLPSAGDVLARNGVDIAALKRDAETYVSATEVGAGLSPAKHAADVQEELGKLISHHLKQNGYEVLPGNRADPQVGDFNPAKAAQGAEINADSIALPKGVKDSMVQYKVGKDRNKFLALNRTVNSAFKRNVLAFNAHWMVGDAVRNSLMSWVSGGVDPMSLGKAMIDAKNLAPKIQDEIFNRPEFTHQGMRAQEATLNPDGSLVQRGPTKVGGFVAEHGGLPGRGAGKAGEGIRAFQDAHFKLNSTLNKTQRMGYSLVKLERELQHRGLSSMDEMGTNMAEWHNPKVQSAINDVINESNRLFGSMDELSPFERRVMTQIFPFWGWMRHVTTIAARTAVDNPARMLWTLRLGAVGMDTSPQDMPDFLQGSLGAGKNKRVTAAWANPFFDIGTGGLLAPSTAMKSTSPLIKAATTAITNRDLNRNLNTVSHAPGTHPNSFANAAFQAATTVPWTRAAINELPSANVPGVGWGLGPVKRYGSGQPLFATPGDARPISSGSRLRGLAGAVSLPLPTKYTPPADKSTGKVRKRKTGLKRTGLGGGLKRTTIKGG